MPSIRTTISPKTEGCGKNLTIEHIARRAGVSVTTVSRVLNHKPDVALATRQRVQMIIDEINYVPNVSARSLASGKNHSIALLFPAEYTGLTQLELDFFVGAAAAAGKQGLAFHLLTEQITETDLRNLSRGTQVDGLILMQICMNDWRVNLLRESGFPFVMIGRSADNAGLGFVDLDFENATIMAFEHLVNLGHHTIGYIARPTFMREKGIGSAVRSLDGYRAAKSKFGVTATYREVHPSFKEVYEATLSMLDEHPKMTGIITFSGTTVAGVYHALSERGLRVPKDASVVAVSTNRIALLASPSLTNINFPTDTMGYQATNILIHRLRKPDGPVQQVLLQPQLILRDSTAPRR